MKQLPLSGKSSSSSSSSLSSLGGRENRVGRNCLRKRLIFLFSSQWMLDWRFTWWIISDTASSSTDVSTVSVIRPVFPTAAGPELSYCTSADSPFSCLYNTSSCICCNYSICATQMTINNNNIIITISLVLYSQCYLSRGFASSMNFLVNACITKLLTKF